MSQKAPAPAKGEKLVYTAKTHTAGGRERLTALTADWTSNSLYLVHPALAQIRSSCCCWVIGLFRRCDRGCGSQEENQAPADTAIDAEVDLNLNLADGTYFLRARVNVSLPDVDRELAQAIVNGAHQICPYSQATRGNIDVATNLI